MKVELELTRHELDLLIVSTWLGKKLYQERQRTSDVKRIEAITKKLEKQFYERKKEK